MKGRNDIPVAWWGWLIKARDIRFDGATYARIRERLWAVGEKRKEQQYIVLSD